MPHATVHAATRNSNQRTAQFGAQWVVMDVAPDSSRGMAFTDPSGFSPSTAPRPGASAEKERGGKDLSDILSSYDAVVIALGPFSTFRASCHRACIRAGVTCLDINDDPHVAREILSLHEDAVLRGSHVFTGMGVNPGLSTALLCRLAACAGECEKVDVRLFAGGNEDAGFASTMTMLHGLTPKVCELREGREVWMDADDSGSQKKEVFVTHGRSVTATHCFSAEAFLIESMHERGALLPAHNISYRMHFQGMPPAMAAFLRRFPADRFPAVTHRLARVFYTMHGLGSSNGTNMTRSILMIRAQYADRKMTAFATGETTFGLTAAYAASFIHAFLQDPKSVPAGVHATSSAIPFLPDVLTGVRALNVHVAYAEE